MLTPQLCLASRALLSCCPKEFPISGRTQTLARLALSLLTALSAFAAARNWNIPQKPFRIAGNIYFVGTAGLSSYLITTPQGDILLDGALPESARLIERNVAALGFHMQDVKYLLNSHAHYDHCGGLAELKRASGARMLASQADAAVLASGHHGSFGAGWDGHFPPVHVDRIVKDGDQVELGGTVLTAVLTPGHTKGCTTWTMRTGEAGKAYDVVFYCSTSVPGYSLIHNREYPAIAADYQRSFARLKQLPCDIFLANHTEVFRMRDKLARRQPGAPNPFIEQGEMQRYVAQSQKEFETRLSEQSRQASLH